MNLFRLAVNRPVTTLMVFIGLTVFGVYALINLPIDLYPEIDPPSISVVTAYPGAGALEVEQNITEELEEQFSTLNGLEEMSSTSIDNASIINLEFDWEQNLDEASNDIRDALSRAQPSLPDDSEDPTIFRFSASSIPVVILTATADESYPNLRQILEDELVTPLNRIDGVGAVSLLGGPQREIQINLDPQRMQAYNISVEQISQVISAENVTIPAGDLEIGTQEYNVRIDTEFNTVEDIRNIVIRNTGNGTIYLRDVATVEDATEEETRIEQVRGKRAVRISIQKQSNANTLQVANAVLEQLPAIEAALPNDISISTVLDTSDFIVSSISNLTQVLFYAVLFVVLVVFVFLRRWRATFIVAITIPFSLVAAFIYLALSDNTLNLISLTSLSIALGMVVDDAIVVLENISSHIEKGSRPREAALYGTNEVGIAVIATTLTVVAVFLPLTFLSGFTGIWFSQLGIIVVVTVSLSTLAALTLIPMVSSQLLQAKRDQRKPHRFTRKLYDGLENGLNRMDNAYRRSLRWSLHHKIIVTVAVVLIFVGTFLLVPVIGTEFFPQADNGQLTASIELPTDRSVESARNTIDKIEQIFDEYVPELKIMTAGVGTSASGLAGSLGGSSTSANVIDVTAQLIPVGERERSVFEIAEVLRQELNDIPEVIDYSVSTQGGGAGAQSPVAIDVIGNDFDQITAIAEEIAGRLRQIEGTRNVDLSRDEEQPALQINFDRDKLASFGLNSATVAQNIRNKIAGLTATEFREQGEEYDIVIRYGRDYRQSLDAIRNINITTPDGNNVEVGALGEIEQVYTPPNIERIGQERAVTVTSDLYGVALNEVFAQVQNFVSEMDIPPSVSIEYGGDVEEQQEAFQDLFLILGISIVLVYIVMAAQFESFKDPFIIMFSLPFAFTGVLLALVLTGTKLSVIAFIGGIILVGIVVKNAIVLVDYVNLMRGRGEPLLEAIVEAGTSRLRPVLMTTLTTLLAMLPLAMSQGEGSEIWKPMAVAVIGGLAFSTLITLIFVPVMYSIFHRKSKRNKAVLTT